MRSLGGDVGEQRVGGCYVPLERVSWGWTGYGWGG